MNKALLCAAMTGVLGASLASTAQAAVDPSKEKCYGIAQAGKNDCHAADGSHVCAGMSTTANSSADWQYVAKGTCEAKGGSLTADAPEKEGDDGLTVMPDDGMSQ